MRCVSMSSYELLWYAMLRCVLCCNASCYAMFCAAMRSYALSCCAMPCYVLLLPGAALLCSDMLCDVMLYVNATAMLTIPVVAAIRWMANWLDGGCAGENKLGGSDVELLKTCLRDLNLENHAGDVSNHRRGVDQPSNATRPIPITKNPPTCLSVERHSGKANVYPLWGGKPHCDTWKKTEPPYRSRPAGTARLLR